MHQLEVIAAWWPALGLPAGLFGLWWVHRLAGWPGVVLLLTGGLALFFYGKGKSDQKSQMERQQAEERLKAIKQREAVNNEVHQMDDATVNSQLDDWLRDNKPR